MKYREFGNTGWQISEIGFGAWAIGGDMWGPQDDKNSLEALHKAVDMGVNFIDTAQGYGKGHSEKLIGEFLKQRSEEIYVATKIPPVPGHPWPLPDNADSRDLFPYQYIIEQCEVSLKRLDRDYLDVLQFHTWVSGFNVQDEWFEAVSKLKEQGKIKAFGASVPDKTPDNIVGAIVKGRIDTVQVIYNIFEQYPAFNLFPVCEKNKTAVIIRVPFDEGALTGKYTASTKFAEGDVRNHYFRKSNLAAVVERVKKIEDDRSEEYKQMPMAEYALRFCLSHPAVSTVIPGIRSVQQAEINIKSSDGKNLSEEEQNKLARHFWRKDFWSEEINLENKE